MSTARFAKKFDGYHVADDDDMPNALAELFCNMTADDQARFFNTVQHLSAQWPSPAVFQWREMQNHIEPDARYMLKDMHDHTDKDV